MINPPQYKTINNKVRIKTFQEIMYHTKDLKVVRKINGPLPPTHTKYIRKQTDKSIHITAISRLEEEELIPLI